MLVRLGITVIVSCGSGAALWAILQPGAGIDPGIAEGAAVGLAALFASPLAVWVAQAPTDSTRRAKLHSVPNMGTLKSVKKFFADRTEEWANLQAGVRAARDRKKIKKISEAFMIYGMPGVGKSEFAQHAAHKLVDEFSRYAHQAGLEMLPRQVELHGLEGLARTNPRDALHALLDLDGPDLRRAKMNLDDLSAEWRKHLQGKFLILILDNADSEEQILPFLPSGPPFILLVTGRRILPDLAGYLTPFPLKELPEDGAVQMIKNIIARPVEKGDEKVIKEIAELFGYHPKAIEVAVSKLAQRPKASLAGRLAELEENPNSILAADEYTDRGSGGVARSFDLSYAQLSDDSKMLLKRLALGPVPTVSIEAATALSDLPGDVVAGILRELAQESLIDEDETRGSYRLHDLIRRYAGSLAASDDPAENRAAVNRLLSYYWAATAHADRIFTRQPAPVAVELPVPSVEHRFINRASVIEWVRAELPNLLACADYAVHNAEDNSGREENSWVVLFACALAGILRNDGWWRRSIKLQTQAAISAEKIHVPLAVANALSERGLLHRLTAELEPAADDLQRAISIYREVGGEEGQTGAANALNTYGVVLDQLGRRDEGRRRLDEALAISRRTDYRLGEANILHDQGMAEYFARSYDKAVQLLQQALELYKAVGQPLGMAHAYSNLAKAQQYVGADRASADNLKLARDLYQELGNNLGAINVQVRLGVILGQSNRSQAVQILNDAITESAGIGNQLAQIEALDALGEIYRNAGKRKRAVDTWSRALRIAREHGVQREEAKLADKIRDVR